jgi:hypothetical protein
MGGVWVNTRSGKNGSNLCMIFSNLLGVRNATLQLGLGICGQRYQWKLMGWHSTILKKQKRLKKGA